MPTSPRVEHLGRVGFRGRGQLTPELGTIHGYAETTKTYMR